MEFNAFTDYLLIERNYSHHTVKAYKKDLLEFSIFIQKEFNSSDVFKANYQQIRNWIIHLVESGISNRTINRKISSLNSYFKFLLKIESLNKNPLAKHKALKTNKKVQVPFSESEINEVLDSMSQDDSFEGVRNKLIVELFYSTGIRSIS